jgi:hypothetical protein
MKGGFLVMGVAIFFVAIGLACGGSTAPVSGSPGGTSGAPQPGPASGGPHGTTGTDAGNDDAGDDEGGLPPDGGAPIDASCPLPVSPDPAACVRDSDCAIVLGGCYCGRQPAVGVSKTFSAAATTCEAKAAATCARGCANFPGQVAQDGRSSEDGTISVHCVSSSAGSHCMTYVP